MYEVEKIVGTRLKNGKKEYQIKWKGYEHSQNTWEPERNLTNAKELLEAFEKNYKKEDPPKAIRTKKPLRYDRTRNDQCSDDQSDASMNKGLALDLEQKQMRNNFKKRSNQSKPVVVSQADKKSLKILAMSETPDHQLVYKTLLEGEVKWVKRSFLIPDYLLELVQFYESNMSFKN